MPDDAVDFEYQEEEIAMKNVAKKTGPNWWSVSTAYGTVGAETERKARHLARQACKRRAN